MGQLDAETDPLRRTTRYGYDAAGRQIRQVDATGTVLSWTYDDTGRNVDTLANESGSPPLTRTPGKFRTRLSKVVSGTVGSKIGWFDNYRPNQRRV